MLLRTEICDTSSALLCKVALTMATMAPALLTPLLLAAAMGGLAMGGAAGPPEANPATAAVRVFLGQRYAEPPLGERRLAPPILRPFNASSLEPSGGPIAGAKGSKCLQSSGGAEDCLFLNIYAPVVSLPLDAGGSSGRSSVPVFFWIHGGGWTAGSGNDYDGTVLASGQNIIVVAINYRLGALGFFASEEARRAPNAHNSSGGMNGLLDMITALQWTQANIARFGGDRAMVTIAGESAGAEAVCNLLVSPAAHGLFKRAVIESGPCLTGSHGWGPHSAYANPQDDSAPQGYLAVSQKLAQHITGKAAPTLADLRAVKQPRAFVNSTSIKDSIDGYGEIEEPPPL
jgi:carboxylesterase type B